MAARRPTKAQRALLARQQAVAAARLRLLLAALLQRSQQQRQASPLRVAAPPVAQKISVDRNALQRAIQSGKVDAAIGQAVDGAMSFASDTIKGAAAAALTGSTAGLAGVQATLSSLAAAAPVGAFATVGAGLAMAAVNIFGGDVSLGGYATTPQLDATTALGIAAGTKQAKLIRQDLSLAGTKFARKGAVDPTTLLGG